MFTRLFALPASLRASVSRRISSVSRAASRVLRAGSSVLRSTAGFSRATLRALLIALVLPVAVVFAVAAAAPVALASDVVVPAGFNVESSPASAGNLAAVLPDGTVLVGTGSFGNDQLSVRQPDGSLTLFATGFGSLAGIAQSPVSGQIVVGDSFFAPALHVLADLNGDGDALDFGENVAHPVALPVLSNGQAPLPFTLAFRPGTDELFVSGSTPFGTQPTLGVVVRIAGGAATVHADGLGFAAGMVWDGATLHVADVDASTFAGRVVSLTDANADGDALDAGEALDFASNLSGASDLVQAADGSFYLSGLLDFADFSGSVGRLLPDGDGDGRSDGVNEQYLDGFGFSGALTLLEGPAGLVPGAVGDGVLVVQDFAAPTVDRAVRSAPLATLSLSGPPANNSVFTLTVGGAPGASAFVLLSTDQAGSTLFGIGDLCAGFSAPYLLLALPRVGPGGSTAFPLLLHGVDGAVGLAFTAQAFTLEAGDVGISNAFDLVLLK
jgi:hypothetical protein